MKTVLRIVGGVIVLVLLLTLVAYFLPRHYRVERSIAINAPAERIYPLVADLRAWRQWGVWFERDPAMTVTYSENTFQVGGWSEWDSKSQGGVGKATTTLLRAPWQAQYTLEFPEMKMSSQGAFELVSDKADANVTTVHWSDSGDLGMNPVGRWFGLFLDKMIGPDFEAGLAKLKRVAETPAAKVESK